MILYQYLNITDILIISFLKQVFYYHTFYEADVNQRNIILMDVFMIVTEIANITIPFLKKCSSLQTDNTDTAFSVWKLCYKLVPVQAQESDLWV
jgi:uncharacterized membrane protein